MFIYMSLYVYIYTYFSTDIKYMCGYASIYTMYKYINIYVYIHGTFIDEYMNQSKYIYIYMSNSSYIYIYIFTEFIYIYTSKFSTGPWEAWRKSTSMNKRVVIKYIYIYIYEIVSMDMMVKDTIA